MTIAIFLNILLFLVIVSFAGTSLSLAPLVPTFSRDLERINRLLDLKSGDRFVEIGAGTAKVSCYIAKHNPDVFIVGIELNFFLYLYSRVKILLLGYKNIQIKFGNAFNYDYSNVNAVFIFGIPKTVSARIMEKVYSEIPHGAKYISYVFGVKNWKGECNLNKERENDNNIYICIK